jgi:8-amino-7-oxononanoate synthase
MKREAWSGGAGDRAREKFAFVDEELAARKDLNRLRKLKHLKQLSAAEVEWEGRRLLNFCSNDYLGLSRHPLVMERSARYVMEHGAGATASRLVCGSHGWMEAVEKKLAALKGKERVLAMSSGFQANATVLPALVDKDSLIVSDSLNHNSIIQGARLARCKAAVWPHNDLAALETLLEETRGRYSRRLVVTESVFSMDGDIPDLPALADLARRHDAVFVVDEAHATGVFGENGMGLCHGGLADIVVGTFGKALGSFGAYVACHNKVAEYLVNRCAGFIYSTALPPSVGGAVDAALDLVPLMEKERAELRAKAEHVRSVLQGLGLDTGASASQIIPVIIGDDSRTMELSARLEKQGILAMGIRPPSVAPGKARIRLTLSAAHTWEHVERLVSAFEAWKKGEA